MDRHLPGKNGFLDKKCISVTDDTAVHRPYVFVTRTKEEKSGDSERNAAFFAKEIGIYCETLTKICANNRILPNPTGKYWGNKKYF